MTKKQICELCEHNIELGVVEKHYIIPIEVMQQAGLPVSRIVVLCHDCYHELLNWYSAKVSDAAYDTKTKKFQPKSWLELYNEYESTFESFVKYKKEWTTH